MSKLEVICGDCLEVMRAMPAASVDLVFTSPPYEAARTYGIGFDLRGQDWVDWAVERFVECLRVCRGLVAWNVAGQTNNYRWSATPEEAGMSDTEIIDALNKIRHDLDCRWLKGEPSVPAPAALVKIIDELKARVVVRIDL